MTAIDHYARDLAELRAVRPLVKATLAAMASVADRLESIEKALAGAGLLKSTAMAAHRETALSVAEACERLADLGERLDAIEGESDRFFGEPPAAAFLASLQRPEGARLH